MRSTRVHTGCEGSGATTGERLQIYHALQVLSPTMRAIVLLRNEGLTFATIAQRLKMHPITAKTYFHRARVKLRAMPFLKKA